MRRSPGQVNQLDRVGALLALIGETRHRELCELRDRFNRPSGGQWGIVFAPGQVGRGRWWAVKGKGLILYADSAAELHDRISSGWWTQIPLAQFAA